MDKKSNISLQLLLLNDLLNSKTIDKDLYEQAIKKISSVKSGAFPKVDVVIPASA